MVVDWGIVLVFQDCNHKGNSGSTSFYSTSWLTNLYNEKRYCHDSPKGVKGCDMYKKSELVVSYT